MFRANNKQTDFEISKKDTGMTLVYTDFIPLLKTLNIISSSVLEVQSGIITNIYAEVFFCENSSRL